MSGLQRGRFISVEGGEGVGKSTFCDALQVILQQQKLQVIRTHEPGGTPSADALRQFFLKTHPEDPLLSETELFVVSAARAQHCGKKIRPQLNQNGWVVSDRFADSSRVYQGILGQLAPAYVESVIQLSTQGLEPDITFLLDCNVEVVLSRLQQRGGEKNRFDAAKKQFHYDLRAAYQQVAQQFPQRFVVLDASLSAHAVLRSALQVLNQRWHMQLPLP